MTTFFHLTGNDVALARADERVLCQYALRSLVAAGPDDSVVLHGLGYPTELLALYDRLNIGPHPDRVHTHIARVRGSRLEPFSGAAPRVHTLAHRYGCSVSVPSLEVCTLANSKAWFQNILGENVHARLPSGMVCTPSDLCASIVRLHETRGRAVRVKDPHSASGISQWIVPYGADPLSVLPATVFRKRHFVLQVEVGRDLDASVQGNVGEDGSVIVRHVTGQHISGQGSHGGNFFPVVLPEWAPRQMRVAAKEVGCALARIGYYGPFSVDFVIDFSLGCVHAVECNARVTAPQYPLRALHTWYGEGNDLTFDLFSVRLRPGNGPQQVADTLGGLLLSRVHQIGFVPMLVLPQFGIVVGTSIAREVDARDYISREVRRVLSPS